MRYWVRHEKFPRPRLMEVRRASALAAVVALAAPAWGVITATGAGTTDPGTGGWSNVGLAGGGSAVYLGNGWVLTARHVGTLPMNVSFGTGYSQIQSTYQQIQTADLQVFRLDPANTAGNPLLPAISPISLPANGSTPAANTFVTLIGNGMTSTAPKQFWDVTKNNPAPWTWTPVTNADAAIYGGFAWNPSTQYTKRWGTNKIDSKVAYGVLDPSTTYTTQSYGGGQTTFIFFDFYRDASNPNSTSSADTANEAAVAQGDSGGGLFAADPNNANRPVLLGILNSTSVDWDWPTNNNQPTTTTVMGNVNYAANVGTYTNLIYSAVGMSEWNHVGNSTWSTAGNWIGSAPNGVGKAANFLQVTTAPTTVTLNNPVTLGSLSLNHYGANKYTIAAQNSSNTLTLDGGGYGATVENYQGADEISAPLILADKLLITAQGSTLTLSGSITNANAKAITKRGGGLLVLAGPQNHAAGTSVTLTAGATQFATDLGGAAGNQTVALNVTNAATADLGILQHLASLKVDGGSSVMVGGAQSLWASTLTVAPSGTGTFTSAGADLHVGTLAIGAGGVANVSAGSPVTVVDNLSISAGGKLNLNDNDLIVRNGDLGVISGSIKNNAITRSAGAYTGLAAVTGQMYLDIYGPGSSFAGAGVAAGDVLVKYTWNGDANLDGRIDFNDYLAIDGGYLFGGADYAHGDFNYSGGVTAADYALIDAAFRNQSGVLADGMISLHTAQFGAAYTQAFAAVLAMPVPEPASALLLAGPALLLLMRRPRR